MTQSNEGERLELSDAAADAYKARREALHAAVADLDEELDALAAQAEPEAERLDAAMHQFRTTLLRHVEEADAADGLLAEIRRAAPWFASRVEQLRGEHAELIERTDQLIERVEAADDVEPLLAEARELSSLASDHRHRGTELLMDAYMLDVSAGD